MIPIYLDYAATTPVALEVLEAMLPYFTEQFANPATLYAAGAQAREAVDAAREILADVLNASPEEICFTSGGTESDNWAIKGMALAAPAARRHLLTTPVEHHAVLDACFALRPLGFEIELLPVDSEGRVSPEAVAARLRDETFLVSVMHANNEIGTIQPVAEIGAICRARGVAFHVDAVQTLGKLPLNVRAMQADLLTLSAHKIYGPKGVGALYVRRGTRIAPFMDGGEQEKGRRAGTLNVPGIVGFGRAAALAAGTRETESARLAALRDRLIKTVALVLPEARLSGPREGRLCNNVHFCFPGVEGESLLLSLDMVGIYASAGSACTAGSAEPSHVLRAIGLPLETARGALRMTLGRDTTAEAVDYAATRLCEVMRELKSLTGTFTG